MISPQPHIVEQAKALTAYDPEDKFDEFIDAPGHKSSIYYPAQQIPTFLYNENYIHDLENELLTAIDKISITPGAFFKQYYEPTVTQDFLPLEPNEMSEPYKMCVKEYEQNSYIRESAAFRIAASYEDEVNAAFLEGFNSEYKNGGCKTGR